MRIVAVDTAQLRVATAEHGIGVFHRVPRGHPGGEGGSYADVAAAARPVKVRVSAPRLRHARRLETQMLARREEPRQCAATALDMLLRPEVARLATDAVRHCIT